MNYTFNTENGNRYAIVPFKSNVCTLMKQDGTSYHTIGMVYAPNDDEMMAGRSVTLTFTHDTTNGDYANSRMRLSKILRLSQTEEVIDERTGIAHQEIVPSASFGRSYQIHTRSGSNYTIADTEYPGISKVTRWHDGKEFEVFTPNYDEIAYGKPLNLRLTDDENVLRTSSVMDLKKMTDAYENPRKMMQKPDKEAGEKFPEWLTDGYEVRTKNTTYRFADTDNPKVKHVYGGQFTGQEVLLESPIKTGEKLYMTLTSAPQNGRLAGKL